MMAVRPEKGRNVSEKETWCGVAATKASARRKTYSSIGRNNAYSAPLPPLLEDVPHVPHDASLLPLGDGRAATGNRERIAVGLG
jgi:hypothetical protein